MSGSRLLAVRVGTCPGRGYLGWAFAEELSEDERRALRSVPVERRGDLTTSPSPSPGSYFPFQVAGRFSRKAEMPSCASAAHAFVDITDFASSYACCSSRSMCR